MPNKRPNDHEKPGRTTKKGTADILEFEDGMSSPYPDAIHDRDPPNHQQHQDSAANQAYVVSTYNLRSSSKQSVPIGDDFPPLAANNPTTTITPPTATVGVPTSSGEVPIGATQKDQAEAVPNTNPGPLSSSPPSQQNPNHRSEKAKSPPPTTTIRVADTHSNTPPNMANDMQQSSLGDSEQIIDTPTKNPSSGANSSQQPPRPIICMARGSHDFPPGYISVYDAGIRLLRHLTTTSMAKNSANSSQQPPRPVIWVSRRRLTTASMAKNSSTEPSLEQPDPNVHQSEPQDSNNGQPSSPKVQNPQTYASIFKDAENIRKKGTLCSGIPLTSTVGLDTQSGTGTHGFSAAPNIEPQNPYGILGGLNTDDASIPAVPHEEGDPVDSEDEVEEVRDPTAQFMKRQKS